MFKKTFTQIATISLILTALTSAPAALANTDGMQISDQNLKQCVQNALNQNNSETISKEKAEKLTQLKCIGSKNDESKIKNLDGIENFPNLKKLELNNNNIENIKKLENLTNLENLSIRSNKIKSVAPL